jgi:hypothetical protein
MKCSGVGGAERFEGFCLAVEGGEDFAEQIELSGAFAILFASACFNNGDVTYEVGMAVSGV